MRKIGAGSVIAILLLANACKSKDPSVLKVFVRSNNNELLSGVKVIIIADVDSEPATPAYVDTVITNTSGFALFDMEEFYAELGKKETTGYFDIIAKTDVVQGTGYTRCRKNITTVETVYVQP